MALPFDPIHMGDLNWLLVRYLIFFLLQFFLFVLIDMIQLCFLELAMNSTICLLQDIWILEVAINSFYIKSVFTC